MFPQLETTLDLRVDVTIDNPYTSQSIFGLRVLTRTHRCMSVDDTVYYPYASLLF